MRKSFLKEIKIGFKRCFVVAIQHGVYMAELVIEILIPVSIYTMLNQHKIAFVSNMKLKLQISKVMV